MADSCSKSGNEDLKAEISKHLDDDKSLEDTVLELEEENVRLTDSLALKTSKVVRLMKSVEALKSERTSLEKQLKESHEKEEKLKDSLQVLEAEKQTALQRLSSQQENAKEFATVSQKQRQIVSDLLKKCNRKGKGFPELKKGIQMLESHIVNFEQHLKKKAEEEAVLEKSLRATKEEKKGLPTKEEQWNRKKEAIRDSLHELNVERAVELMDDHLAKQIARNSKSYNTMLIRITRKAISIGRKKERTRCKQIKKLRRCLRSVRVKKQVLEESLQRMETEKQTLVDQLTEEKEKIRELSINRHENSNNEPNKEEDGSSQPEKFTEDIRTQESNLVKQLEECRRTEEALRESLRRSEAEADLLLDELDDEKDEVAELLTEIQERKVKCGRVRRKLNMKEKEMSDLSTDLKNSLKTLKSAMEEKVALEASLRRVEAEKQALMDQLSVEKGENGTLDTDLSKQNDINKKEVELSNLKKKFQTVKSEKRALGRRLRESAEREAALGRSLQAADEEKRRLNIRLIEESEKCYDVERIIKKRDQNDKKMEMRMAELDKKLNKDSSAKMAAMKRELHECRAKKEALEEGVRNLESEKRALLDDLDVERKKIACLENELNAKMENILHLRKELIRKKIEVIKTSESMANIQCEKVMLEKNLWEKDIGAESLRNSIVLLEADKRSLSDTLIVEKEKSGSLQVEVAKLKSQMGDHQKKTKCKRISGK